MKLKPLELGKRNLTCEDVKNVAVFRQRVQLSIKAKRKVTKASSFLQSKVKSGETFYGINTGFGLLSNVRIQPEEIGQLQLNLIRSHATGVGEYLTDDYVRSMLLLRAATLIQGHSGVSVKTVLQLIDFLNHEIHPLVPVQGSVGASGDLAPLAHLALGLIGEGKVRFKGKVTKAILAIKKCGLKPLVLGPKEGLALINGTQFMTAIGAINQVEAEHLCDVADIAGAMTIEGMRGTASAFDPLIHQVRPHPGQITVAKRMRSFLGDSEIARSHENCGKVQDPYSLRCIPQVHGAVRDMLKFSREVLEREMNSVTDNPLLFPDQGKIVSGGNFHGQIVSFACDTMAMAVCELASISQERLSKLVNPVMSDLPAFLTKGGGLNSGFMIVQVAAAAIVSENKTLAHPASVDSIPTSADKEDHVSMGAWASRKAAMIVTNTRRVLSMECLAAAQAIDLLRPLTSTKPIERVHKIIRTKIKKLEEDRVFHEDLIEMEKLISSYILEEVVGSDVH